MRIGLVIYGSLDTVSGGYLYDRRLVEYLRAQGDTVEILSQPWQSYPRRLAQNFDAGFANHIESLGLDLLLEDELNHPSLFLLNRRLRQKRNYPILSIVHHLRSSEQHPSALMGLYRRIERRYLQSVDGFVFNSQTTRHAVEVLLGRPAVGLIATPGGDRFGEVLSEHAVRLRARKPGPLRMLFVGNVIPRKGLMDLIFALGRLETRDCLLHIVGRRDADPTYAKWVDDVIEELDLKERVFFLGPLADEYLRDEWKRCHVLVVPSQYEGFGIVYLEGMAFGVPPIATTAGAAGEIITDGQNGFLVPPGDSQALAGCLAHLVTDRRLLERMSLSALRRFSDFPTWQSTMENIHAYLLSKAA